MKERDQLKILLMQIRDPKPEDLMDKAERETKKPEPHVIDRLQSGKTRSKEV